LSEEYKKDPKYWYAFGSSNDPNYAKHVAEQLKDFRIEARIEIFSLKNEGVLKCPRCWKYSGIDENPLKLCDGCCSAFLEMTVDDIKQNTVPEKQEEQCALFLELQEQIRIAYRRAYGKRVVMLAEEGP